MDWKLQTEKACNKLAVTSNVSAELTANPKLFTSLIEAKFQAENIQMKHFG